MVKMMYFKCYKCGHYVYTDKIEKTLKLPDTDCPECGEEGFENWIVIGEREVTEK